jgi:hypothetical protein
MRKRIGSGGGPAFALVLALALALPAAAATFTVNVASDSPDAVTPDSLCDVDTASPGLQCSLRAAIEEANATAPVGDSIHFNLAAPFIVAVITPLPAITSPLAIDGTTQSGFAGAPLVIVEKGGSFVDHGLQFIAGADGSSVRGLEIRGFAGADPIGAIALLGAGNVTVAGNYLGPITGGSVNNSGVFIITANNRIGGSAAADRNVISGNDDNGAGVDIREGGNDNVVVGNYIGTDPTGLLALGNSFGLFLEGAARNRIGGSTSGERNVISGNTSTGVEISGAGDDNVVIGNYVGVDAVGTAAIANGTGIAVEVHPARTRIGGAVPGERNIVSGNTFVGIFLTAIATSVRGNYVGLDPAGTQAIPNGDGIVLRGFAEDVDNVIGGSNQGDRNVISGNEGNGVLCSSPRTVIEGNLIGTSASGQQALANGNALGGGSGVQIFDPLEGAVVRRNVISGNRNEGLVIGGAFGGPTNDSIVEGNLIGLAADRATPLGNGKAGLMIGRAGGAVGTIGGTGNALGGTVAGAGNTIAHNGGPGVVIEPPPQGGPQSTGNPIRGNVLFGNGGLGIDLEDDGPTLNDDNGLDADDGPNRLQNFPLITAALTGGASTSVSGSLDSLANTTFALDFFASVTPDPGGFGEGERYLGSTPVATDGAGKATFSVVLPIGAAPLSFVTATATAVTGPNAGDTSELSPAFASDAPITAIPTLDVLGLTVLAMGLALVSWRWLARRP